MVSGQCSRWLHQVKSQIPARLAVTCMSPWPQCPPGCLLESSLPALSATPTFHTDPVLLLVPVNLTAPSCI